MVINEWIFSIWYVTYLNFLNLFFHSCSIVKSWTLLLYLRDWNICNLFWKLDFFNILAGNWHFFFCHIWQHFNEQSWNKGHNSSQGINNKWRVKEFQLTYMAIWVVKFPREGYKIAIKLRAVVRSTIQFWNFLAKGHST